MLAGRCLGAVHSFLACEFRQTPCSRSFTHNWLEQVGAALFVFTEKWSFGAAIYFCTFVFIFPTDESLTYVGFITFTTTGFGDYTPKTAAGRSVFVSWALLGLAATTILVSGIFQRFSNGQFTSRDNMDTVLQEVFSSKYKNVLHGGGFESVIKKYRQEKIEERVREVSNEESDVSARIRTSVVGKSSARAQQILESLPEKVLEQARVFHRFTQCLGQAGPGGAVSTDLRLILDDIGQAQKLDEKMKDEILEDYEARNVSTTPSLAILTIQIINLFSDALHPEF